MVSVLRAPESEGLACCRWSFTLSHVCFSCRNLQLHIYTKNKVAENQQCGSPSSSAFRSLQLKKESVCVLCNNPPTLDKVHTLHQCIIKLTPLQPLLVVSPGWCRHAAVRVQQDPEASDQQEDQEEHEEAYKSQGSTLFCVHRNQGQRSAAAATARTAGQGGAGRGQQQLVVKCGHIVHPPRGPKTGLTHWMDGRRVWRRCGEGGEGVHCRLFWGNANTTVCKFYTGVGGSF